MDEYIFILIQLSRYIGIHEPGNYSNHENLRQKTNKITAPLYSENNQSLSIYTDETYRSNSNKNEENNYKHKDLFTKHKLKQQTLRVKDQKCEL